MKKIIFLFMSFMVAFGAKFDEKCKVVLINSPVDKMIQKMESNGNPNIANYYACMKNGNFVRYSPFGNKCGSDGTRKLLETSQYNLTGMTLGEITKMQDEGKLHATGLYQIVGETLKSIMAKYGRNQIYSVEFQQRLLGEYFFVTKRRAIGDYLMCNGDLEKAGMAIAQEWSSKSVPTGLKTRSGKTSTGFNTYYDGGGDNVHVGWDEVAAALQQTKNQLIDNSCASCEKEEVKEPEPNNPPPGKEAKPAKKLQEYTPTAREDVKYKSKARKPTASYKRNASPQCYCNKS